MFENWEFDKDVESSLEANKLKQERWKTEKLTLIKYLVMHPGKVAIKWLPHVRKW